MVTIYEQNNVQNPNVPTAQALANPAFGAGPTTDVAPQKVGQNLGNATIAGTINGLTNTGNVPTQTAPPTKALTPEEQRKQSYQSGLKSAQDSGTPPPDKLGGAMDTVKESVPPPPPPKNPTLEQLKNDPGYQALQEDYRAYKETVSQQQTLTEQYKSMETESGLPALKLEAMNLKNIIDGTTDDIRAEITKAGGFATESQVQAMTNARNKVNILNYNKLNDQISNVQNHIDTMIGLSKEDKANALQEYKTQIDYDKTINDYTQKFNDNAKSAYQKIVDTPGYGYKALYDSTGGDPALVTQVETSMGLPAGSLQQLSTMSPDVKTQVVKLDNGSSILINSQTGSTIRNLGGATLPGGVSTTDPYVQAHVASILNGNETMQQVPTNLRNAVALAMANAPKDQYSPLAASRFTTAANKIVSNYVDLPQYKLTAGGLVYLQRIDAAMKTPGSVSDQDLLDSLTKLNTGGNAVTDAQVSLITGGKSFSDMASTFQNKFKNGGVLSDSQRQQIQTIAKAIYDNYKKGYKPVYEQATKQLSDAGIPRPFWTIPDLNNLSAQIENPDNPGSAPSATLPSEVDSALEKNAEINEGTKTVTIPRSVWSTFGTNMDLVLSTLQSRGYQLLVK